MADPLIRYDAQGTIATIALDRPDALNALTDTMNR
jgi:enoyl-CoA hydratase/carnithine racemase